MESEQIVCRSYLVLDDRNDFLSYFGFIIDLADFDIIGIDLFSNTEVMVIDELFINIDYFFVIELVADNRT